MEEIIIADGVRSRLLLSGLKELERHGVSDFSLRRVAQDAGVSCAAPYRHFKDKDELISSIIAFVLEGWTLLSTQLGDVFSSDSKALLTELMVAGLRFWVANGNFRTVIVASASVQTGNHRVLDDFDEPIIKAIERYKSEYATESCDELKFKLLSMLYGTIILVDGGYESADIAANTLRNALSSEL